MPSGVIIKGIGGFYYVKSEGKIYECKARGLFRKEKITPMVGDRVEFENTDKKCSITEIKERDNAFVRPPVANVDLMAVTICPSNPEPNLRLVDSFLLMSEAENVSAVICINKTDISDGSDIKKIYESAGYKVIMTSAKNRVGTDELKSVIKGKITAFTGNSGVGKSSLLNALGIKNQMQTGELSDKTQRGKHTTRHVELLETEDGDLVLDTPGFSSFEMPEIKKEELQFFFPEFEPYIGKCRFRGCAHINEPDCAVKAALEDKKIADSRYESYKDMYEERKNAKEY